MTTLYDMMVPSYLQTLGAAAGVLDKGAKHFAAAGVDPDTVVSTRLFDDMLPFSFQILSVCHHSRGALEGVKSGTFSPPAGIGPQTYAELQALVAETQAAVSALSPDEVNSWAGKDVFFDFGGRKLPFKAEGFLLSFSFPNFYFHATTAYDILRTKGVPLGKRDFMGAMRMNLPAA